MTADNLAMAGPPPGSPGPPRRRASPLEVTLAAMVAVLAVAVAVLAWQLHQAHAREDAAAAKDAAAVKTTTSKRLVLSDALNSCSAAHASGVKLGDDGRSVLIDAKGEDDSTGASMSTVACVLNALHTPDSVVNDMDATRALDGRQHAAWGDITADWSYHPNDGLNLVMAVS